MNCSLNDFYIKNIGRIHYIDEKIYTTNHVEYRPFLHTDELILFKDTVATVFFNDYIFHIEPDDILYLPHGIHEKYIVNFQKSGYFIDVFFESNIPMNSVPRLYKDVSVNIVSNYFKQMLGTWQQDQLYSRAKCMSLLWEVLYEIQRDEYVSKNQYKLIEPAIEQIHSNYLDTQISVEKLALRCGISYSYFLRIFQKRFSTTPKKYITKLKLDHACELLRQKMSVTDIAETLGFSDVYFFSRQFKKYMNMSPLEYRKKILQNHEYYNRVQDFETL